MFPLSLPATGNQVCECVSDVYVCVCVCVDHLYRCKTSPRFLSGSVIVHDFTFMQGDGVCFRCLHPTKTHLLHNDMDWGRSIHVPAQSFFIFVHGNRPSLEPARRFVFNFVSALLSQSGIIYGHH